MLPVPIKDEVTASGLKAAKQRLDMLKKRLDRDQRLKTQYTDAINDLLSSDYAERVPEVEVQVRSQVHYLPHHPVINPNIKSKLRIVFDCAAKAEDGKSLNDHVWSGPDLTNRLVGVLLRFREELIAVAADITAMFHQVHVAPQHRDLLRFLWWTDGDTSKEPEVYRMKVHLFGGTWSPSCAAYALRKAAEDQAGRYAEAVCKSIERNFYVDDFMKPSIGYMDQGSCGHMMNTWTCCIVRHSMKPLKSTEMCYRDERRHASSLRKGEIQMTSSIICFSGIRAGKDYVKLSAVSVSLSSTCT